MNYIVFERERATRLQNLSILDTFILRHLNVQCTFSFKTRITLQNKEVQLLCAEPINILFIINKQSNKLTGEREL